MTNKEKLIEYLKANYVPGQKWQQIAEKFGFTAEAARNTWLRYRKSTPVTATSSNKVVKMEEDIKTGKGEITIEGPTEIKSLKDLETLIDTDKWEVTKYVQSSWSGKFQVKAWLEPKVTVVTENFTEFLKTYKPAAPKAKLAKFSAVSGKVSIILPKQDAHYNKFDIMGDNSIEQRFEDNIQAIARILARVTSVNEIEEAVYVVGSDEVNSEWMNTTTKGTPQQNILTYHQGFTSICDHEVEVINMLLETSKSVKVVYVPGNHDEFVGWHIINWLETYYRNEPRIKFDTSILNTKYYSYGNSAVMLNHGDKIKPRDLASKFPRDYKEKWSETDFHYIFTGDKHTEFSADIHGIKYYRVPQLSNAKSGWDDKMGYTDGHAEMTAFVLTENRGMSDILKEILS